MKTLKLFLVTTFILLQFFSLSIVAAAASIDDLMPRPGENPTTETNKNATTQYSELEQFGRLPEVDLEEGVGFIIKTILGWAMSLTTVALVTSGIYMILAQGEEEKIGKAKNIIKFLIIGMLVMASAYGIVSGIAKFDFFQPQSSQTETPTTPTP